MSRLSRFTALLWPVLLLAAARLNAASQAKEEVLVAAAASLSEVFEPIGAAFTEANPGIHVIFQFAASGLLQQQIEQGAPVDVFVSAATAPVEALQRQNLVLAGSVQNLFSNRLVLIVPQGARPLRSLTELQGAAYKKIAIGENRTVPAGQYAEAWLGKAGLLEALRPRLVPASSVRQVLTLVATGNAPAGFVYATDAKSSAKVKVALEADPSLHPPIVYPLALVTRSKHKAAAASFATFLQSPAAQSIIKRYGFVLPGKQAT